MEEEIDYSELLLTVEEFQKDIEVYNFYNGDYNQYLSEQYN